MAGDQWNAAGIARHQDIPPHLSATQPDMKLLLFLRHNDPIIKHGSGHLT
jgi:hypothetical protein